MKNKAEILVDNLQLEYETILSQGKGHATQKFHLMIYELSDRLSYKFTYKSEDDRQDIVQDGYLHSVSRYNYFDSEKSNQAFSYFSEICKRRFSEFYYRHLIYKGMKITLANVLGKPNPKSTPIFANKI